MARHIGLDLTDAARRTTQVASGPIMGTVTRDLWEGRRGDINQGVGTGHSAEAGVQRLGRERA